MTGEHQYELLDFVAAKFYEEPGVFKMLVRYISKCIDLVHIKSFFLQFSYLIKKTNNTKMLKLKKKLLIVFLAQFNRAFHFI